MASGDAPDTELARIANLDLEALKTLHREITGIELPRYLARAVRAACGRPCLARTVRRPP